MAGSRSHKNLPLSMHLPDADIAIIDRAAKLRGSSRTEFIRNAAVRAAEEVFLEHTINRMSLSGSGAFVDVLDLSAQPVPEMVALLPRPAPWDTNDVTR